MRLVDHSASRARNELVDQALEVRLGRPDGIVSVVDLAKYKGALEEHRVRVGEGLGVRGARAFGQLAEPRAVAPLVADRRAVDEVGERVEAYQAGIAKPTSLAALSTIVFLGFGGTALAAAFSEPLAAALVERFPDLGDVVNAFTLKVLLVTAIGVAFSFTRVRKLEGVGASAVGSLFLYVLVATIGAKAEFSRLLDAPVMLAIGAVWMIIHVSVLMLARRLLKAPIFFAAVGSKANVGGAASAPIVAHAFHPALAPVGVLLAVAGYALGTPAGVLCAYLLKVVDGIVR